MLGFSEGDRIHDATYGYGWIRRIDEEQQAIIVQWERRGSLPLFGYTVEAAQLWKRVPDPLNETRLDEIYDYDS